MSHFSKLMTIVVTLTCAMSVTPGAENHQPNPYQKEDDSWITISGTVTNPSEDSFTLDYGQGVITVELDDYDVDSGKEVVTDGNRVTVSGRIDDNWFSRTSINAVSVYDQERNQYSRSNNHNNSGWRSVYNSPVELGRTTITGEVSSVYPDGREFTVNTSAGKALRVDTWNLNYNPLDDYGYQKIKIGDRVSITGNMTRDFIDQRHLHADMVTSLNQWSTKTNQSDLYQKADESWINISGTVINPKEDSFTLDYGQGVITVEMDDYDLGSEKFSVIDGNRVTVSGKIDDNWFSRTSINAISVYDQDRNQYVFSNNNDDYDYSSWWYSPYINPIETGKTTLNGKVSSVDPGRREFTVRASGGNIFTVDTWDMNYNPLDDYGYQKIEVGDQVSITGNMSNNFVNKRRLNADIITTLREGGSETQSQNNPVSLNSDRSENNQPNPYQKEDESWISISGTVTNPSGNAFTLDYGQGVITVQVDDFDTEAKDMLKDGHRVTVNGRIDANWFSDTEIDAISIYNQDRNQYERASFTYDDHSYNTWWHNANVSPVEIGRTTIIGKVSNVDRVHREFTITPAGGMPLTINTWTLDYNPLDVYGYQKINIGDRVSVTGTMTRDFTDRRQLNADVVTTLSEGYSNSERHKPEDWIYANRNRNANKIGKQENETNRDTNRDSGNNRNANRDTRAEMERKNENNQNRQDYRDSEVNRRSNNLDRKNASNFDQRQRHTDQYDDGQRTDNSARVPRDRANAADREYRDSQQRNYSDNEERRNGEHR